jgi:hypothetical protein
VRKLGYFHCFDEHSKIPSIPTHQKYMQVDEANMLALLNSGYRVEPRVHMNGKHRRGTRYLERLYADAGVPRVEERSLATASEGRGRPQELRVFKRAREQRGVLYRFSPREPANDPTDVVPKFAFRVGGTKYVASLAGTEKLAADDRLLGAAQAVDVTRVLGDVNFFGGGLDGEYKQKRELFSSDRNFLCRALRMSRLRHDVVMRRTLQTLIDSQPNSWSNDLNYMRKVLLNSFTQDQTSTSASRLILSKLQPEEPKLQPN